jgi:hypothetical protein
MKGLRLLSELLALAEAGKLGDDGPLIAAALRRYFEGAPLGVTLDDVFGLTIAPGKEPWWSALARDRRDDALRRLAALFCPLGSIGDRETIVRAELRRYERRWQRVDRHRGEMPPDYSGRPEQWLFEALRAHSDLHRGAARPVGFPLGTTQLRAILGSSPSSV